MYAALIDAVVVVTATSVIAVALSVVEFSRRLTLVDYMHVFWPVTVLICGESACQQSLGKWFCGLTLRPVDRTVQGTLTLLLRGVLKYAFVIAWSLALLMPVGWLARIPTLRRASNKVALSDLAC